MRSGTLFFDFTIFNKNIQRYWPLWGSYLLIWLMSLPGNMFFMDRRGWSENWMEDAAQTVHESLSLGLFLAFVFGLGAAMLVFGYLYNSRAACMTHALPLRRETLFWSSYWAGLAFLIGPHLIVALFTLGVESMRGVVALESLGVWLLGQSAMCLFFYSFAVFCGMFTGHILALPIFYGILNFLVWYLAETVSAFVSEFLYGMSNVFWNNAGLVAWFTPMIQMIEALRRDSGVTYMNSPEVLAVYAAAGVALTVLALLVYRRRHIESAGDVVAVRIVRPVFQYGVAISVGLLGTILLTVFWGIYDPGHLYLAASLILWSAAGYFAATMLLDKTFRVFHKWKGAAGLAAVLVVFFLCLEFDVLGYEHRVPKVEDIQDLSSFYVSGFLYDQGGTSLQLDEFSGLGTDPDRQAKIIALHQALVDQSPEQRSASGDNSVQILLDYTLANGSSLTRRYYSVPVWEAERNTPGTVSYCVEQLIKDRELVRHSYGLDQLPPEGILWAEIRDVYDIKTAERTIFTMDSDLSLRLWDAVQKDFDEGNIAVPYLFTDQPWQNRYDAFLSFYWSDQTADSPADNYSYFYDSKVALSLTPQARHTLAVLEESGALEGYVLQ